MERLNYHHLHYFWVVAREGSVTKAGELLGVSQPTVTGQIRELEKSMRARLFTKSGRGLVLTDVGKTVFRYAEEIFSLGQELADVMTGRPLGRPMLLRVGIVDVMPKLVAHLLLSPALKLAEPVRVFCAEGKLDRLAADLTVHNLDLILSDSPLPMTIRAKVYTHLLGECGVVIMGVSDLVEKYEQDFPKSLDGAPFLLPMEGTALRRSLDQWFATHAIRPVIKGEFEDSALLKAFGRAGEGVFAVPTAAEREVRRHFNVEPIGPAGGLRERFYAISVERKIEHPAVLAISQAAEQNLNGG